MNLGASTTPRATLDDLARTPGKAELVGGKIIHFMPTGFQPHRIALRITRSLDDYAAATGRGVALGDNMGFAVPELSSGRQSFAPDAAHYIGPLPTNRMRFIEGPPTLAVEVRSESDYGDAAEESMAAKRADYFEAGTLVVWDVDPIAQCVRIFRADAPDRPVTILKDQQADAEPAVPGWRLEVDRLFP
jgi:Uma2 family endonuclease